jgi:hypothetical protein
MKKIILILLLLIVSCTSSPKKNEKLSKALDNSAIVMRGTIVKIPNSELRFDYYDTYEKDSDVKTLERMNYQSGGYSWEGIIYGAITLSDEGLLDKVRFDPEADGIAIWSNDEEALKKIGRLITVIKTDKEVLKQCIKTAEDSWKME